jgi:hypothetical protein
MNDSSPSDPRFDEPSVTRQVAANDWARAEIETPAEPPPPKERLFPRKVLIGWALFAVALYFGVRIIGTVVKETVKTSVGEAVTNAAERSGDKEIIYRTPNGKITISRDKPNGAITISTDKNVVRVPAPPTPDAAAAPKAPSAVPAPKAVPAPTVPPTKR